MEALFLPHVSGRCFGIYRPASSAISNRGAILHVPPFAEEMNKSRRMVGMQSRALAGNGWSVLQLDLFGCGDSEGDFGDATWERWVSDVIEASRWLQDRTDRVPVLWGMRAGALLVARAAAEMKSAPGLLFWQPVLSGAQHLQQFLRMKVMGHLFGAGEGDRSGTQALRQALKNREPVEVAGYMVSPDLAAGLESATLPVPIPHTHIAWLEVASSSPPDLSPASKARIEGWRGGGIHVESRAVAGLPFWQTQEITECQPLIDATCAVLEHAKS